MSDNTMKTVITSLVVLCLTVLFCTIAVSLVKETEISEREETARHTLCLESADPAMCIALSTKKQP